MRSMPKTTSTQLARQLTARGGDAGATLSPECRGMEATWVLGAVHRGHKRYFGE
jgi:hypothetical protein